jgi:endoglucanase
LSQERTETIIAFSKRAPQSAAKGTRWNAHIWQAAIVAGAISLLLPSLACSADSEKSSRSDALPGLHASGAAIVNDKGQQVVLRGCNLGNWLLNEIWMMDMVRQGEPGDQWQMEEMLTQRFGARERDRLLEVFRANWIRPRDFEIIKTWGFNVVRLPFNSSLLEDDASPGVLRTNAFLWLDRAIEMATQARLYLILDMHGAPGRQSTDQCTGHSGQNKLWLPENQKRADFLWRKIAERYKDSTTVAAYDLLNEPYGNYGNDPPDSTIVATMNKLVRTIREVDQKHLILCAGSIRGITMYGSPASRGWKNVGYTEHFYPGLFGGSPTLETHAKFISRDLRVKASLLKQWQAPYLAGEFNVVFERAGGADMMRRYYDTFASNGWAATMWSYKLVKHDGGCHPDNWYLVTNRDPLSIPSLRTSTKDEIENFFKQTGIMEYAQDDVLRTALTSRESPNLVLHEYPIVLYPAPQDALPDGWEPHDVGNPFLKGGQRVVAKDSLEIFGGGRDVFEGSDECYFVCRNATNRFELSASLVPPFDTHTYAKTGLMYRASLDPDAPIVMVSLFPDGTCTFAYRRQAGARITEVRLPPPGKAHSLRLLRNGAHFEVTALDIDGKEFGTQSFDMPELATAKGVVGFFVLSHEALLMTKAAFSNIRFQ